MTAAMVAMAAPLPYSGNGGLLRLGYYVLGVPVDMHVDVVRERRALFLGQLAEEPARPREQREPAQHGERQAEVGEHRAADARPVERQGPAEYLRVHPADRLEQPQVRAPRALLGGDLDEPRCARVEDLVHRVTEAGYELPRGARLRDGVQGECVIERVVV